MTDVSIRLTDNLVTLSLIGTQNAENADVVIRAVKITKEFDGNTVEANLDLATALTLPAAVLDTTVEPYKLKNPTQANDANAAGALSRVRQELAKRPINVTHSTFFALPVGTVASGADVALAIGDDGKITMRAQASLDITAKVQVAQFANATVDGRLDFAVKITEDEVRATIDMIIPDQPELGFSLPEFAFPSLSFDGVNFGAIPSLNTLNALKLPVPDWLPDDLIKLSGGAPFTGKIDSKDIVITTGSDVTITVDNRAAITIKNFKVKYTDGDVTVDGAVETKGAVAIDKTFRFGGASLPVRGGAHIDEAIFVTSGDEVKITWKIARLWLETTSDPDTRIAVALDLISITQIADGATKWSLANLKILDLGGDIRLPEIGKIGGKIRIKFGVLWKDAEEFLSRLLRILGAVARWLGETLGPIPGLLAELAETLGELLADAILAILKTLNVAQNYVTLELRLDAATFRPEQIVVTINDLEANEFEIGDSFLELSGDLSMKPALILDFENHWQGLALLSGKDTAPKATLSSNLWIEPKADKTSSIPRLKDGPEADPLLAITATLNDNQNIVLAAVQHGKAKFFQSFGGERGTRVDKTIDGNAYALSEIGDLTDLKDLAPGNVDIDFEAEALTDKLLALMPQGPANGGGAFTEFEQYVQVGEVDPEVSFPKIELKLPITITVAEMKAGPVDLKLSLDVYTMHSELEAGEEVFIEGTFNESLFGMKLRGKANRSNQMFRLSFTDGDTSLALAKGASVDVIFDQLSASGTPLTLSATEFGIGRGGLDLVAETTNTPVRLAGLDQPFRFTSGSIFIRRGELQGGTISGSGPMPPALIGEANAEIDIVFGRRNRRLVVTSANAKLEKEGEPLYSTGTKFKVTLDALGLSYREPEFGPVQFFFQLWGSASFEPASGEFDGGMLKNIRSVAIKLDGAPLTGDGRELVKHISFLVELDPPLQESLFDIFGFELRGIAFYPASKSWPDTPPAIGLSGQVSFLEAGDVVSSEIDFHELLLAPPEPGGSIPLPRIRADGLSVLLRVGDIAQVEASAVAVDGTIPTLYAPVALPADVTADGFLASGRIDISGLGAFGGAMGFLELRREGNPQVKNAMFLYGQAEKLTERIDTPIGPLFIREAGFGFGKNYTLSAMAAADRARSPRELVKVLDEVSKVQGNLTNFNAWTPQFDKDAITIALRGMISLTATSASSASYDAKGEKELANPLLMDIVLGLRTDFTFFANIRGWLATNYNDWFIASSSAPFKERPTLRGYLYFSVPRKELLARFLSDPTGMIGNHPELDKNLVKAIQSTRFAATLYIRPGLYHCEFGWPYELGFTMGNPGGNFHLDVSGGLVLRIEDATMLYGLAFKASGHLLFGGTVGNANFGASATARADFLLGAKFIAYIAPLNPKDTLFYGEIYLNLSLRISVNIWMSFKIFRKRFTLRIGFSIGLTISVSAEVVLSGQGVGAKVHAAVGVSGFGRTLSVGVGFSFGDSKLAAARARVARFMDLGLGIDPPKEETLAAPAPAPEVNRARRAQDADTRLDTPVSQLPSTPPPDPNPDPATNIPGVKIKKTDFWALLFSGGTDDNGKNTYLMMLVPRDASGNHKPESTFFAEPFQVIAGADKIKHERNATFDYQLTLSKKWKGIQHVTRDADRFKLTALNAGTHELKANLDLSVGQSEHGAIDLNALMAECFLDPIVAKEFPYTEPLIVKHDAANRLDQPSARDQRVYQATRNFSDAQIAASLAAEEKRSALITQAGESAFDMAAEARRRRGAPVNDKWAQAAGDLAAPDFGLTFVVTEDHIKNGDLSDGAQFSIEKRIWENDAWTKIRGTVTLLNHPDASYEEQQPRLDDDRIEVDQDGFKLLWDLEPAFGSSEDIGFENDPETMLAHYRIERSFEGSIIPWIAEFQTRTATPLQYTNESGVLTTSRQRARMHLCDDFSQGDVPEDLRALLIGSPIPSKRNPVDVWAEAFGSKEAASVVYKIVAVDLMGTETRQRVLERPLTKPAPRAPAPLNAELLVEHQEGMPVLSEIDSAVVPLPHLELAIDFAKPNDFEDGKDSVFQLRVRTFALRGGGQYGADALDDSQNRPGQADIDSFHDGLDTDLFLVPLGSDGQGQGMQVSLRFQPSGSDDADEEVIETRHFRVLTSRNSILELQSEEQAHRAIAEALRVPLTPTPSDQLRACRVFLRNLGRIDISEETALSGPWLTVQTQLVVRPTPKESAKNKPLNYSATVELLETPLSIPFLALQQDQIERAAGRLELVYPEAEISLEEFLNPEIEHRTLRRLDPELRSGIRLDFNASAAQLSNDDKSQMNGLVAGFDIFEASPSRLRMRSEAEIGVTRDAVVEDASKRATVKVLPRSLAGLFPDKLPDFRNLEVRYPSETWRTDPENMGNRPRARWYSDAESLVAFPERRLRLSLFPTTEETLISALLDEFLASEITVSVQPVAFPPDIKAQPGKTKMETWASYFELESKPDLIAGTEQTPELNTPSPGGGAAMTLSSAEDSGIKASELRAMLRGLVLKNSPDLHEHYRAWRRGGSNPDAADAYRVRVKITAQEKTGATPRAETIEVNLATQLHPVIADTLDALSYKKIDRTGGTASAGQVYRAYEVELEPVPPQETKGFDALLDGHSPSSDPYGWSALRAFGLAAGFRVYDIDAARFLIGKELLAHVNTCFMGALDRYAAEGVDLGHPSVELVDLPETFMGLSSMDDRSISESEDAKRILRGDTAILQIGLRPRAAQQRKPEKPENGSTYQPDHDVKYLVVTLEDPMALQGAPVDPSVTFPDGFIFDTVGLPDADGLGATRYAADATATRVFGESSGIAAGVTVSLDRLRALQPRDVCFVLRATRIDRTKKVGPGHPDLKALQDVGLDVGDWHAHPVLDGAPSPAFETFPALDPVMAAFLQARRPEWHPITPLETLLEWLPPDHLPSADLAIGDVTQSRTRLETLVPLVARVTAWTARFLPNGAAQVAEDSLGAPKAIVAFAALTSEESYARVPDGYGRVSAFFIDPARLGREHFFAIRPYGRYASIETMVSGLGERPITLEGGLPDAWQNHCVAVSLDRTKPPEPPAILAARKSPVQSRNGATGIEVVIARTADQIASEANLDAERALQAAWTGLEFRAHYQGTELARTLLNDANFDPFDGFETAEFQPASDNPNKNVQVFTPEELNDLRSVAPDAWRGAIRYDLSGLPHFFETAALVHQSAGAVVSDISAAPLPRSGRKPSFPPFSEDAPETDPRLSVAWGIADRPVWSITHEIESSGEVTAHVAFDLPMMRNLDLMPGRDLLAWTNGKVESAGPVYFLPDVSTSYRISTDSADLGATLPQIDLLPARSAGDADTLYSVSLAGDRFVGTVGGNATVVAQAGSNKQNWRLQISVEVPGRVAIPTEPVLPAVTLPDTAAFTVLPTRFDAGRWANWSPVRRFAFTVLAPDPDAISRVVAALEPFKAAASVEALISDLQDADLAAGDRIEAMLPLGLAKLDLPPALSDAPADYGAFSFPDNLDPLGLSDADVAQFMTYASQLDAGSRDIAIGLLEDLQDIWAATREVSHTRLGATYVATKITQPQGPIDAPFAHFRIVQYSRADETVLTANNLQALIGAVQALTDTDRFVIGTAVRALRQVVPDTMPTVTLPLAIGTAAPTVAELKEVPAVSAEEETFAGVHWLPDSDALSALSKRNALKVTYFRIAKRMIFGQQSQVRLTGFAGSDGAKSVSIDQKGDQL
ncbi:hypothetical protein [Ruegeria sp. HKCCD6428]|uniref:hypothetical protein n=1 Tax=Ruegeria sp. HKCCD6428 TaxID=2683002 RepID=UPI001490CB15|nr:hypothetical protein [Ruegeria sp. HKCCD6428]NOC83835.1 hypothetical protein [Ruegeria sp. HKCCD6428]